MVILNKLVVVVAFLDLGPVYMEVGDPKEVR